MSKGKLFIMFGDRGERAKRSICGGIYVFFIEEQLLIYIDWSINVFPFDLP